MPLYAFRGRQEQTGQVTTGIREAPSHAVLGQDLLSEGILLTSFEEKRQRLQLMGVLSKIFGRVPIIERVLFARYFSLMLRAGLDVKRSLAALQEQTKNKTLKNILGLVYSDIERGKTLSESMEKFPTAFSSLFTSFIRVGESTGQLQQSLGVLAEQLRKEYELRRAVRGAMLYPLVILTALFAVGFAMLVFVIPKLAEVFKGFNVELPLPTRILLSIGTFFESYWYIVLIGLFVLGVISWFLWRVKTVRAGLLKSFLYVPILGPIMQQVNIARFCRNLSSLIGSGVSFTEALGIMSQNTPHPSYAAVLAQGQEHVKNGKILSQFLSQFKRLFPPLIINVMKVGEETGELDKVLSETALFYEGEVDQTMKNMTSILEPVLMVLIGLAVGGLAISVISPIYNLVNVI